MPSGAPVVTTDDLGSDVDGVLERVSRLGRPTVITRYGRMVAVITPLDPGNAETAALAHSPEVRDMIAVQERRFAQGRVSTKTPEEIAQLLTGS